ncbi:MAG: ATP-binding cassette domain-containing protein [Opitutales bacterium]
MFECRRVQILRGGVPVIHEISTGFRRGEFSALVGTSGGGKSTFVKALLGLIPFSGDIRYRGHALTPERIQGRVGYVPQFSVAYPKLTVEEAVYFHRELHTADRSKAVPDVLRTVGLEEHRSKRVEVLSGGQLRRLSLAMELILSPEFLVCDEVTTGLDPAAEGSILELLKSLTRAEGIGIVCVIHNLDQLPRFDWMVSLSSGRVAYQGPPPEAGASHVDLQSAPPPEPGPGEAALPPRPHPPWLTQWLRLLQRRSILFGRDRGYLFLVIAITLGFPLIVVLFAWNGLPQIQNLGLEHQGGLGAFLEEVRVRERNLEAANLATALIMFQVILLTLIGSNNGAREIAGERPQYEHERLHGLSTSGYLMAKLTFTGVLAFLQGLYMMGFVKVVCGFPGSAWLQGLLLGVTCLSMTWVALGLSALYRSAERASLASIYLVGFQFPLSGVVLALPEALTWLIRPFIHAYWGWAGYLSTMRTTRLYDAWRLANQDWLPPAWLSAMALSGLALAGVVMILVGCRRRFALG